MKYTTECSNKSGSYSTGESAPIISANNCFSIQNSFGKLQAGFVEISRSSHKHSSLLTRASKTVLLTSRVCMFIVV